MARFSTKKVAVEPTETNFMGEKAFKLKEKEELVSTVMTTFLEDSYYEKQNEIVDRITSLLDKVDPLFTAKLAIYARNNGNLRSVTHLMAAYIARNLQNKDWAKRFYKRVVIRPDDMTEILSAYAKLNGMSDNDVKKIPNSMKKGFKEALEGLDAYRIDKYKMKTRSFSLVDLVRLFHPKATNKNAEAYKRLIEGKSLANLYDSKILEKEMTKAGQKTKDMTEKDKVEAKKEAITTVINNVKGMPVMNLLRNLRNILLYAPDKVTEACEQLTIKDKIMNSRLLPFRFATAYSEIEKLSYYTEISSTKSLIQFEDEKSSNLCSENEFRRNKEMILNAIEKALETSCLNIPKLEGNVAVLVDDSGSMRGDAGGSSRVSAFSKTSTSMIAHLFASMVMYRQDNVYLGLFGDKLINVPVKRNMRLLDYTKWTFEKGVECGGATETGIYDFIRQVVKEKKKIDNIIVFSDCQIGSIHTKDYHCSYGYSEFTEWYGIARSDHGEHFHELFKEFRKINPNSNFIVVNLRQNGSTSVFDRSQRILNIAGWSDKIFDVITSQCKGWDAVLKEIETIEI